MKREPPILADLVFLGGGHAQIAAIKSFAMNPVPGLRLTIVTANIRTPYSGMLPAYVEGVWDDDDLHIDLAHLAQFSGARLIVAPCSGIDADGHKLLFDDRPPLHFDILSINIDTPTTTRIPFLSPCTQNLLILIDWQRSST